jgi:large subunit ribosomal protein L15
MQKRQPKRGFNQARFAKPMKELNVNRLQEFIDAGRLDASKTITMKELYDCGIVGKIKHGVKLLAGERGESGRLTTPVRIEVSRASTGAIEAVEAAGGRVTSVYYNDLGVRALTRPDAFLKRGKPLPRRARPKPKIMPYYQSFENRGYLSPEMQLTGAPFFPEGQEGCPRKMRLRLHPESAKASNEV